MNRLVIITWIVGVILLTCVGYILLWHGAVYLESANTTGVYSVIYLFEVVIGSIILWPVVSYGWITHWLTGDKGITSLSILLALQGSGYFALFWFYQKLKSKKA